MLLEANKIRSAVLALGWPKASYCICVLLLVRGIVTFDQCLLLIFSALLFQRFPNRTSRKGRPKQGAKNTKPLRSPLACTRATGVRKGV